jgi:hypothetical protein
MKAKVKGQLEQHGKNIMFLISQQQFGCMPEACLQQ